MSDEARKALAETWEAFTSLEHKAIVAVDGERTVLRDVFASTPENSGEAGTARARIAACAPEALRLLLEAEWSASGLNSYDEHSWKECPWCGGAEMPPASTLDGSRPYYIGHAPDCQWLALMEKAGLRDAH